MNIAFVINDIETEKANYTTVTLALKAHNLGHQAYLMSVADLTYYPDGLMGGKAYKAPAGKFKTGEAFMKAIKISRRPSAIFNNPSLTPPKSCKLPYKKFSVSLYESMESILSNS